MVIRRLLSAILRAPPTRTFRLHRHDDGRRLLWIHDGERRHLIVLHPVMAALAAHQADIYGPAPADGWDDYEPNTWGWS